MSGVWLTVFIVSPNVATLSRIMSTSASWQAAKNIFLARLGARYVRNGIFLVSGLFLGMPELSISFMLQSSIETAPQTSSIESFVSGVFSTFASTNLVTIVTACS